MTDVHAIVVRGKTQQAVLDQARPFYDQPIVLTGWERTAGGYSLRIETNDKSVADRIRRGVRR